MNIVKKIQIYGDSIMKGILLDTESKRYYPMKQSGVEQFEEEFSLVINNRSKFGCTIEKGYTQLLNALEKGITCDMVLLEYGGNDCDFNWEDIANAPEAEHQPHTPIMIFEATYRKMLLALKENHITPIIMSLPPIDGEKYLKWVTRSGLSEQNILKFLGDTQMIYRFQELYSLAAARIAFETNTLFVDVRSAFLDKHNYKQLICEDGIHPSEDGHQLINQIFFNFAKDYLQNAEPVFA